MVMIKSLLNKYTVKKLYDDDIGSVICFSSSEITAVRMMQQIYLRNELQLYEKKDYIKWKLSSAGDFSTKYAHRIISKRGWQ